MDDILKYIAFTSNLFTICASGIAIYLFFTKRKTFSSVFHLLINYSYQLTLSELKEKLEKLNDYNAKNSEQNEKIVYILNDIIGQIRGNNKLRKHFSELLTQMENLASDKRKLTEPRKRALVSELRERIRHLNLKNIDGFMGE